MKNTDTCMECCCGSLLRNKFNAKKSEIKIKEERLNWKRQRCRHEFVGMCAAHILKSQWWLVCIAKLLLYYSRHKHKIVLNTFQIVDYRDSCQ